MYKDIFQDKTGDNQNVAVIGLGRVGLPLAVFLAEKGYRVIGVDNDALRVEELQKGKVPFMEDGLEKLLKKNINQNFNVTGNLRLAAQYSQIFIITIGTPVDEFLNPVHSYVESLLNDLLPVLKYGDLIILRSTVAPGTTELIKNFIEKKSTLKVGEDIFLAFCPERIAEGKSIEELPEIPQIIGSIDQKSGKMAKDFFEKFSSKILSADSRSAELAKLYCNMYRYINFAIANEFMIVAEEQGCNIYDVLNLVNNGYKRGGLKQPGFTAGPCLYKDGFFLVNKYPFSELITISWRINEMLPCYLVDKIKKLKPVCNSKVVILGLAFKKNNDDPRNSLSYKFKKLFTSEGAEVFLHDPYILPNDLDQSLKDADIVVIGTNHDIYENILPEKIKSLVKKDCIICDVWNLLKTGKIFLSPQEINGDTIKDLMPLVVKSNSSGKRILVTGGCGFIGTEVVKKLLSRGYYVRVADDLSKPESSIKDGYDFVKVDLTNKTETERIFQGMDICINLAAKIGGIGYFHKIPATILSENNKIYSSTFEAAVKNNIERMVYCSSSMVYESTDKFPSKESDIEKIPPPVTPYGFSKLTGEWYCKAFFSEFGLKYSIVRPFNAYGINEFPGNEIGYAHVIPDLIKKILSGQYPLEILGDGSQTRCFTHVSDLAEGILTVMESEKGINEDFNLANPQELKIIDLAKILWDLCGRKEDFKVNTMESFKYDIRRRVPDVTKAKELLGWESKIRIDQGLREVVFWLKNKIESENTNFKP